MKSNLETSIFLSQFTGSLYSATLGGLLGNMLTVELKGLDFVMTAMFVVIFMEQLMKEKQYYTAVIGIGAAVACRLLFNADSFMIPTMITILVFLTVLRRPIERKGRFSE